MSNRKINNNNNNNNNEENNMYVCSGVEVDDGGKWIIISYDGWMDACIDAWMHGCVSE